VDAAAGSSAPTAPLAALTTSWPAAEPGFFRTVARLGVQAAEALEHATNSASSTVTSSRRTSWWTTAVTCG
jgi:hypothetical protein